MKKNHEGKTKERVQGCFMILHHKSYLLSITHLHPVGLSTLTEHGSCGQLESLSVAVD